jgi:hypothetical protein
LKQAPKTGKNLGLTGVFALQHSIDCNQKLVIIHQIDGSLFRKDYFFFFFVAFFFATFLVFFAAFFFAILYFTFLSIFASYPKINNPWKYSIIFFIFDLFYFSDKIFLKLFYLTKL